jgi:hypothetical protein
MPRPPDAHDDHMTVLAVATLVMFVTGSVLIGWWARDWRQAARPAHESTTRITGSKP